MFNVGMKGDIVVVEYERGRYIRDVEFQLSTHHTEAGFGEKLMMCGLVTPELLGSGAVEHKVGKRFVVRQNTVVLYVKHRMKILENGGRAVDPESIPVGRTEKAGYDVLRRALGRTQQGIKDTESAGANDLVQIVKGMGQNLLI